jgi:aryl-alcohol dehydrogenase-like predicted oxidoreductase
MEYRYFGRTGYKVSPLCLGTMNFGGPTDEAESIRIIHAALDAGINFVDTANSYTEGRSESIVGKALQGRRSQVFLATKVRSQVGKGPNDKGLSRVHIMQAVEDSLRRLNTDHIDLYQTHRPEPDVPVDETLSALTDLVRAGKVRYIGCSTHAAWMIMEALAVSEREHLARYVSEQPPYNLLDRRIENELVPLALRYQLAIIPWAPLAQGMLAGRYKADATPPEDSRAAREANNSIYSDRMRQPGMEAGDRFTDLAKQFSLTPAQLALLWCKDQPGITAPIFGPRTMEQLQDVLPVMEMKLTDEQRAACDRINPPGGAIADYHNSTGWMKARVGR